MAYSVDIRVLETVFQEHDVFWTHYWEIYEDDVKVNGGLATSYADAVMRSDNYLYQHKYIVRRNHD